MEKKNGVHFHVSIGKRGELMLPPSLLYYLGWRPGDTVSIRERRATILIEDIEEAEFWLGVDFQPWYLAKDDEDRQSLIDEEKSSINWGMTKELSDEMFGPSALPDHWNMDWEAHQIWEQEQRTAFEETMERIRSLGGPRRKTEGQ